jgi:hypothetical protein
MVIIGRTDEFEHRYTEKFRNFAAQFGHFVAYERDVATRDIGLHLTEPMPPENSIRPFQLSPKLK